jgi:hypothetical protein
MSLGGATTVFEAFMAVDAGAGSGLPPRATRARARLSSRRRGVHARPDARGWLHASA